MLTAGEMLRDRRLEQKLTFVNIGEMTKIPTENLRLLEKSQFDQLPEYTFLKGIVQNYAKILGLDPVKILAIFRRDYDRREKKTAAFKQSLDIKPWEKLLEKPSALFVVGLGLFLVIVFVSLWRVYQPPQLTVISPKDGQTAISPVVVEAKTDRDASLKVNGQVVNLTAEGNYLGEFTAKSGDYELIFEANSRRHKTSRKVVKVKIID